VAVFVLGIGATFFSVFNELSELSPVEEILVTVNENPKVTETLGANVVSGGFPNGNISVNNNDGEVKFSIPVEGEKGKGTLYVNGIRANKKWVYEDLYIIVKETAQQINLLTDTR